MYRTIILTVFILVNLLFFLFNWDIFTTYIETDLLVTKASTLPFFILQGFSLIFLLLLWFIEYYRDVKQDLTVTKLQKELMELKKENEIKNLKAQQIELKAQQTEKHTIN